MVQISKLVNPALKSECDIFALPSVQNTVSDCIISTFRPISIVSESGPIEILIPASNDYIDISSTILYMTFKLVRKDGTELTSVDHSSVVNLPAHSFFEKITVLFNNKVVSSNNNYAYRAYIENFINYGKEAKNGHLQSQLYYKDTAGKFDDIGNVNNKLYVPSLNKGFLWRNALTTGGREIEVLTPLHIDVLNQPKYIIDNVDIALKFYPHANSNFYTMGHTECKIKITDI